MRISPEQLAQNIQTLAPAYLIAGDEELLVLEAMETIRKAAAAQQFTDRQVVFVDKKLDPGDLPAASGMGSLFGDKTLLELRFSSTDMGRTGSQVLRDLLDNISPDQAIVMSFPSADPVKRNAAWVKAFDQQGVVVEIKPVYDNQFPAWMRNRLKSRGLRANSDVIDRLCYQLQGNLLAAAQEVDRLALWCEGEVSLEDVDQWVGDSARFSVFGVMDSAIQGNGSAAIRAVRGLRGEGEPPQLLLWAMHRELRHLTMLRKLAGQSVGAYAKRHRMWPMRQRALQQAANRHPGDYWAQLLRQCQQLDAISKGRGTGDIWELCEQMLTKIAS